MSLTIKGYAHTRDVPSKKLTEAYKEIVKKRKKSGGKKDKVDISELGKKWEGLSKNQLKVLNNLVEMNNPYEDYINEITTVKYVSNTGVIVWNDIYQSDEEVAEMKNDFLEISKHVNPRDFMFWRFLSSEPAALGLRFTNEEIRERLSKVGIQQGFFTVSVGQSSSTNFLTHAEGAFAVHSKEQYDQRYHHLLSENFLKQFEAGQKFLIDGVEYMLGEDRKLNVPYGVDIYDLKRVNN